MKKVAIVGGGIVGMSTALFLKTHFDVTLFEREEVSKPLGAGIMLQPSGLAILKKLNLHDSIIKRGVYINGFSGVNTNGKVDFDISFEKHNSRIYGLGVQRGSVFYELLQAVNDSNIKFITGADIINYSEKCKLVTLKSAKDSFGEFDFVVVANGAKSLIRNKFSNFYFAKQSGQAAIWTKVNPIGIELPNRIQQVYNKTYSMLGLMPIGYEKSKEEEYKMSFFFGTSLNYVSNWQNISLEKWKKHVLDVSQDYKPFLDQIDDKEQLVCAPYCDVCAKRYSQGSFVFIGDAAHAMGPHLSSGTNLGLLDAYILSQELIRSDDYVEAFQSFEKQRRSQLKYYQTVSRIITPYFQSEFDRSFVRSHLMKYMYKLPILKNVMVETITGKRLNLFNQIPDELYLSKEE